MKMDLVWAYLTDGEDWIIAGRAAGPTSCACMLGNCPKLPAGRKRGRKMRSRTFNNSRPDRILFV